MAYQTFQKEFRVQKNHRAAPHQLRSPISLAAPLYVSAGWKVKTIPTLGIDCARAMTCVGGTNMKIWYQSTLNFAHHPNYAKALAAHFQKIASPGTEVLLHGREDGPGDQLAASDIIGSPVVYQHLVDPAFIRAVLASEEAKADAFVAASFSEPILPELRGLAKGLVVSMPQACFVAASTTASKIGFVTLNRHIIPYLEKSISLHKWRDRVSGIHAARQFIANSH
jgi:Asp/Glu/Hydantoin racemase